MLQGIYRIALLLVVVCVLVVLIAPDVDLPDSPPLRANHGAQVLISSLNLVAVLLLLIFALTSMREKFITRFNSPTHSSLCTFLC